MGTGSIKARKTNDLHGVNAINSSEFPATITIKYVTLILFSDVTVFFGLHVSELLPLHNPVVTQWRSDGGGAVAPGGTCQKGGTLRFQKCGLSFSVQKNGTKRYNKLFPLIFFSLLQLK